MHELALARSIERIVLRAAGGRVVKQVNVDVGALRQVVAPTLINCWSFVRSGNLGSAELSVNLIPAVISCKACLSKTRLQSPALYCGTCGSREVAVTSGDEFVVASIDVEGA
ncbi:MAG: hydrogenase maturation nickel metallochaperone HypA [Propionibacteriaceae bacterium]|jgi:hydrogenase nickel incorporation protein HypA/HybF|nr:hydrogenase maturation nickel metallochaperone HypA [Propionibacteriaceae bacterium]